MNVCLTIALGWSVVSVIAVTAYALIAARMRPQSMPTPRAARPRLNFRVAPKISSHAVPNKGLRCDEIFAEPILR